MAKLIKADGTQIDIQPANGRVFSLAELQNYVGGYIELVIMRTVGGEVVHDRVMFVNEEGKLSINGRGPLPRNRIATAMSGVWEWGDFVCGDVVVCTPKEAGNNDTEDEEAEGATGL
jgi:hypothetical protein